MTEQLSNWNITPIDEGRLFEHKQTGKIVFVPKKIDTVVIMNSIRVAIKSLIKEMTVRDKNEP
jgi:hypothetical protein